jgi:hypothetical protein
MLLYNIEYYILEVSMRKKNIFLIFLIIIILTCFSLVGNDLILDIKDITCSEETECSIVNIDEENLVFNFNDSLNNANIIPASKPFKISSIHNDERIFNIYFDYLNDEINSQNTFDFENIQLLNYSIENEQWLNVEIINVDSLEKNCSFKIKPNSILLFSNSFSKSFGSKNLSPADDANYVLVRPNPFIPNDGNEQTGVNYGNSVAKSGLIFDKLPANSLIKIFTVNGFFVHEKMITDAGYYRWDTKNDNGAEVASGVYIFTLSSPHGKTTGKFVIIR